MKKYESINIKAERIAGEAYKDAKEFFPSILSLIKWTEKKFEIKMEIKYTNVLKKGHSGLVYFDPVENKYKIWINSKEPECRQKFTICHEIGHIIKKSDLVYGLSDGDIYSIWGEERFCNRFAASFLMPKDLFIQKWKSIATDVLFKKIQLTYFFKVSGDAIYYRAKELGLIKERR